MSIIQTAGVGMALIKYILRRIPVMRNMQGCLLIYEPIAQENLNSQPFSRKVIRKANCLLIFISKSLIKTKWFISPNFYLMTMKGCLVKEEFAPSQKDL